ncbi:MAG: hypothetical protein JSV96_02045, partial [Candidatus Aminicenantes bacterium]
IGDGGELIQYGVSSFFILILGIVYFLIALFLWAIVQQLLGITSKVLFYKRLVVLCCGITPYLLMIFLYNLLFNNEQILIWSSFALIGIVTCFVFSIAGHFWAKLYSRFYESYYYDAGYKPVAIVNIIGIFIIMGELVIFGIRENPF